MPTVVNSILSICLYCVYLYRYVHGDHARTTILAAQSCIYRNIFISTSVYKSILMYYLSMCVGIYMKDIGVARFRCAREKRSGLIRAMLAD